MNARLCALQVVFVWIKPTLIRVFERGRERRHYLSTISQIAPNLRPFLQLANFFETAPCLHSFLEFIKIERSFVDAWETIEIGSELLVEFRKLV